MLDIHNNLKLAISYLEIVTEQSKFEQKYSAELENPQKDALLGLDTELARIIPELKEQMNNLLEERL